MHWHSFAMGTHYPKRKRRERVMVESSPSRATNDRRFSHSMRRYIRGGFHATSPASLSMRPASRLTFPSEMSLSFPPADRCFSFCRARTLLGSLYASCRVPSSLDMETFYGQFKSTFKVAVLISSWLLPVGRFYLAILVRAFKLACTYPRMTFNRLR